MYVADEHPTADRVQAVAGQALRAIRKQEGFFAFLLRGRKALHREIAELADLVCQVEPSKFTEDDFADLGDKLTRVTEGLEGYFAKHGDPQDVAECQFLGSSLQRIKDARHWIAQGLSPDPAKRPTEAERRQRAEKHAATVLSDLFA